MAWERSPPDAVRGFIPDEVERFIPWSVLSHAALRAPLPAVARRLARSVLNPWVTDPVGEGDLLGTMSRGERWAHRTDTALLVLAIGFLVAYAIPILFPLAPLSLVRACTYYEWMVWAVFAIDYLVRLGLSEHKRQYVRTHVVDLLAVILPMFRAMRLLRLLSIVTLAARRSGGRRVQAATTYVIGFALLLVVVSSLAVLDAERLAEGSKINTFADSVWWSLVTMTTVGYGDLTPVTATGRVVGILVMLTGIAVLGVVTANISSWFVSSLQEPDDKDARIEELEATIARLSHQLEAPQAPDVQQSNPE